MLLNILLYTHTEHLNIYHSVDPLLLYYYTFNFFKYFDSIATMRIMLLDICCVPTHV